MASSAFPGSLCYIIHLLSSNRVRIRDIQLPTRCPSEGYPPFFLQLLLMPALLLALAFAPSPSNSLGRAIAHPHLSHYLQHVSLSSCAVHKYCLLPSSRYSFYIIASSRRGSPQPLLATLTSNAPPSSNFSLWPHDAAAASAVPAGIGYQWARL
jgi:hypothetical protein